VSTINGVGFNEGLVEHRTGKGLMGLAGEESAVHNHVIPTNAFSSAHKLMAMATGLTRVAVTFPSASAFVMYSRTTTPTQAAKG